MTRKWTIIGILAVLVSIAPRLHAGEANWSWYCFPAVANAGGQFGTYFRTDMAIVNPYDWKSITLTFYYYPTNTDNSHPSYVQKTIPAKGSLQLNNVLQTLFNVTGSGAMSVSSTDSSLFFASARTYTQSAAGTYGLMETGQSWTSYSGDKEFITSLRNGSGFRTNVGIFAYTTNPMGFAIDVFDSDGNLKGSSTVTLKPNGHLQVGLASFASDFDSGYAVCKPLTSNPDVAWNSYATVIDNTSGDSIFVYGVSEQLPSTVPSIGAYYNYYYGDAYCHHFGQGIGAGSLLRQNGETFTYTIANYGTVTGTLWHNTFTFTLTFSAGGYQTGCDGVQVSGSGTVSVSGSSVTLNGTFGAPATQNRPPACTCLPPPGSVTLTLTKV